MKLLKTKSGKTSVFILIILLVAVLFALAGYQAQAQDDGSNQNTDESHIYLPLIQSETGIRVSDSLQSPPPTPVPGATPVLSGTPPPPPCKNDAGSMCMENGSNDRLFALDTDIQESTCPGHSDTDWLVTYRINNDDWQNVRYEDIRFYTDDLDVRDKINNEYDGRAGSVYNLPNSVTLCLSNGLYGLFGFSREQVQNVWLWILPPATPTPTSPATPTRVLPPTSVPPPSGNGIELVSAPAQNVQPGQQFNPSVTIRVKSGQLLVSRGDHLHAIPEDTTNTFGAWPVQAVKHNISAVGEYTFDVNNDSGFRMTAPTTPGTYVSRWQLRMGGNHIGPVIEIPITVGSVAPPPRPPGWRAQYWNGYYTDNPWGNGRCRSDEYTDSIPFTKSWGSGGPGGGCSGERFSVLYERRFNFTGGRYRFHCHRDGYCRIFIPELGINHAEEAGSFAGMDWGVDIPAGNWEVKIEYSHRRENGDSRLEFWWQGPDSYLPPLDVNCDANPYEWCAAYRVAWNSPSDSYILRRLEGFGYLDHNWGGDSPGYGIYPDFSAEWSRLAQFDAGLYRFHVSHDDGVRIVVDNQEIVNQSACCREDTADVWLTDGDHRITVNWFDSGGNANLKVWWEKITACYRLDTQIDPSGAGTVNQDPEPNCPVDSTKYKADTAVSLQANANPGYSFWLWRGEVNDSSNPATIVMNWDKSLTAYFLANPIPTPTVAATPTPMSTNTSTPLPTNTPVPSTPTATRTPIFTPAPTSVANGIELLSSPWHLVGNNGAAEAYQGIASTVLQGKNMLRITYDLHGLVALGGDASAIIFDQNGWRFISLSNYGQNGRNGQQTVDIPLSAFPGLNPNASVGTLHTRFWYGGPFVVDIYSIVAYNSGGGTATPVQTPTRTPTPTNTPTKTPAPTNTVIPTPTPTVASGGAELLTNPWHLVGNNGAAEAYQSISPTALQGKNMLRITYNLHGLQALGGDASAIIFDQNGWRYISLANYGQNGKDGVQTVDIPLSHFPGLNLNANVGTLHTRFWYSGPFVVDITSIVAYSVVNAASETTSDYNSYLPLVQR